MIGLHISKMYACFISFIDKRCLYIVRKSIRTRWYFIILVQFCCIFISVKYLQRGFLYGGTRKLANFLNGIRKNCTYFGGLWKTGILSYTEILYFEGRNKAKFKSYWHWYYLNSSVSLCQGANNILVPKSDQQSNN